MPQDTSNSERSDPLDFITRRSRKAALAIMMAAESGSVIGPEASEALFDPIKESYGELTEEEFHTAEKFAEKVLANLTDVDASVQKVSPRWKIERMAAVDRNILRLGAFEILNLKPEPLRKVILDYVQLGREFGEKNTHAFVNGLLDQLCQDNGLTIR